MKNRIYPVRLVLSILFILLVGSSGFGADRLMTDLHQVQTNYQQKLSELADSCDENGLSEQAKITRDWAKPLPKNEIIIYRIPEEGAWEELPEDASPELKQWSRDFQTLRIAQSIVLIKAAIRFSKSGRSTFAFELLMQALRENPQQKKIRNSLGFVEYQNKWMYAANARLLRSGLVDHPRFGWIPAKFVSRYESGQRYYQNRWMTAEQERQLRLQKNDPWIVESVHYKIASFPSLEEGVVLSRKLETLYLVWHQLFIRYFATEQQMRAFFSGQNPNFNTSQHKVMFFRDRQQYIDVVMPLMKTPMVAQSLGLYYSSNSGRVYNGVAYFFAGEEYDERTMYHEATHQLFAESRPFSPVPKLNSAIVGYGNNCNFWIAEGAAMFMETLRDESGNHVLGGDNDERFFAARFRMLKSRFYIPLGRFCATSRMQFQSDPRLSTLYSQAAGLTWFLIYYDEGKYRDCLVSYLSAVYSGLDTPDILSKLTNTPFSQLDKEYLEYIQASVQPDDENMFLDPM